jgi:hypothetical protein
MVKKKWVLESKKGLQLGKLKQENVNGASYFSKKIIL